MKSINQIVFIVFISLLFIGCNQNNRVEGKWSGKMFGIVFNSGTAKIISLGVDRTVSYNIQGNAINLSSGDVLTIIGDSLLIFPMPINFLGTKTIYEDTLRRYNNEEDKNKETVKKEQSLVENNTVYTSNKSVDGDLEDGRLNNEYIKIFTKYEEWKSLQYKTGEYLTEKDCNLTKEGGWGIPRDIQVSYSDINGDNKIDGLITFSPDMCGGGNATMNVQIQVLILSKGTDYFVDDKFFNKIEEKYGGGIIESVSDGVFFGTQYEYGENDGRCCPSIKKPFIIDYKTKKLTFTQEK